MNKLKKVNRPRWTPGVNQGIALLMIVAFAAGCGGEKAESEKGHKHPPAAEKKAEIWTCAMHPQIKLPKPGKCPICGMDLIPVKVGGGDEMEGPRTLTMSDAAKKLAEIQTSRVELKFVTVDVRMVGKVDYDETKLAYITAWVPGRLDRLYVDYTGVPVKKGDHMVYIYSPQIYSAEEELLQAIEAARKLEKSDIKIMRDTAVATVEASRERLRLWGLTPEQIQEIELRNKASDHITIYAPIGGIVIHKEALEGMYVQEGTKIYTIADLTRVWIMLDAYESDLAWIRYGQDVEFTTEAYPGDVFTGRIAFIDPVLNERTRTVKVRVNAENSAGKLKPGMFVRAVVKSHVATGGQVMDPSLAGKWICPMHPDVIEDHAGDCPICGMPLVRTESLGYVSADEKAGAPLVIPASAPLITGKRAVVYVQVPGKDRPTFEGREIVLGKRAGDYYIVRSGLKKGELVVTHGNFKIDSAIQIEAKPSMMTPEGGGGAVGHQHGEAQPAGKGGKPGKKMTMDVPQAFRAALTPLYRDYFQIQESLAADGLTAAIKGYQALEKSIEAVDMNLVKGHVHMAWMEIYRKLTNDAVVGSDAKTLVEAREAFRDLSKDVVSMERQFGHAGDSVHYLLFCPMAFSNKGASWLQTKEETRNPYFGSSMLKCGEVTESFPSAPPPSAALVTSGTSSGRVSSVEVREKSAEGRADFDTPEEFRSQLSNLLETYLVLQECLAADDRDAASDSAESMKKALAAVDMKLLKGPAHMAWMKEAANLEKGLQNTTDAKDIEGQRRGFALLSETMPIVIKKFKPSGEKAVYLFKCPMAFGGRGATWLQATPDIKNPYFGKSMIKCGEPVEL
ncbi:MAG: efflux RND transporter periplasmic adaptor subunit [Candidatus Tritonobacter lacicola]|nr:efflux RND transporter periplasmic adaptor subunit [Candidatus Tritonobacter lacicola]